MNEPGRRQTLVESAARRVIAGFDDYNASFADITRRGRRRFEAGDRAGMRDDVVERISLYDRLIDETIAQLEGRLENRLFSRGLWKDIRSACARLVSDRIDAELYKTFFNTITRRVFRTRGVDTGIEFVAPDFQPVDRIGRSPAVTDIAIDGDASPALRSVLDSSGFSLPFAALDEETVAVAERLAAAFAATGGRRIERLEFLDTVFYREGRAYRVGRIHGGNLNLPCVLALCVRSGRIRVEAVLTRRRQLSILFGFTFSYFLADLDDVAATVAWLRHLLPAKPVDELYTVLGRAKQGKTERYRAFARHMTANPDERFVEAEGTRGMVMLVFTLPGYPLVFKLIRDRFAPTKKFGRDRVIERYRLVYRHDRVGRLLDVQEFRHLGFARDRFSPALLELLTDECGAVVRVDADTVLLRHCYVERRVRPLDLYLDEADDAAALEAVLDYGQALKDLARSNIFAGDLLPKNFGVTRSGRVVFYDYDELRLMTECRFRHLPETADDVLEFSDEPWFSIRDGDVFPEQFARFMGLPPGHLALLRRRHGELFEPGWWQDIRSRIASGASFDVAPYGREARLARDVTNRPEPAA